MGDVKNIPEKRFTTGVVNATVWLNQGKNEKGEAMNFRTVSFSRRYADKDGKWKSTNSLRVSDLPKAALVLKKAFEYLTLYNKDAS
jgi:hypothetical protein